MAKVLGARLTGLLAALGALAPLAAAETTLPPPVASAPDPAGQTCLDKEPIREWLREAHAAVLAAWSAAGIPPEARAVLLFSVSESGAVRGARVERSSTERAGALARGALREGSFGRLLGEKRCLAGVRVRAEFGLAGADAPEPP